MDIKKIIDNMETVNEATPLFATPEAASQTAVASVAAAVVGDADSITVSTSDLVTLKGYDSEGNYLTLGFSYIGEHASMNWVPYINIDTEGLLKRLQTQTGRTYTFADLERADLILDMQQGTYGNYQYFVYTYPEGKYVGSYSPQGGKFVVPLSAVYAKHNRLEFIILSATGSGTDLFYGNGNDCLILPYVRKIEPLLNVKYVTGGANEQNMDIYYPAAVDTRLKYPVVMTVHGGIWYSGAKYHYGPPTVEHPDNFDYPSFIGKRGLIQVNIEYRGINSTPTARYTDMLDDIESALDYLAAHADELRVDTSKVALWGHSAGAHLALLYAYTRTNNSLPVKLVIGEGSPVDVTYHIEDYSNLDRADAGAMVGVNYGASGWRTAWNAASPTNYADTTKPLTVLCHGSERYNDKNMEYDGYIPIVPVREMVAKMGNKMNLFEAPYVLHNGYQALDSNTALLTYRNSLIDKLDSYKIC